MQSFTHADLFDLDRTLFTSNSSYSFALYLYRKKIFSSLDLLKILSCKFLYSTKILNINGMHEWVFKRIFYGRSSCSVKQLAAEFVENYFNSLIHQPVVRMLDKAKSQGHYTAILSSSPSFIVEPIALQFGVHKSISTCYKVNQYGNFSDIEEVVLGQTKADFVDRLVEHNNLLRSNITGYTDSIDDLPFLEAVGNPIGVNPDRSLFKVCKKNSWKTI